jgi:hypothetical protein
MVKKMRQKAEQQKNNVYITEEGQLLEDKLRGLRNG